jgi:beta-xylosidase
MSNHLAFALILLVPLVARGAEPGTTTYRNPLVDGEGMADPDVLQVGKTYYLYPTWHTSGYDAWTSTDLVHWKHARRVFDDPRGGAWAPDVFQHAKGDGKFYLYYTDNDLESERGDSVPFHKQVGVAVADSPLGPFVDKRPLATGCIDAHLFEDDDGKLYLYYVNIDGGFKIMVQAMSDPLTKQGEPREVLHPTEPWETAAGEVTEGPFMLKRGALYYLMYSGSGADSPHYAIGYATAKSPLGPFEKYSGNPIAKGGGEVVGPGHHSVVTGPDGKLWMLYHQKYNSRTSFRRFLALDPVWFDDAGVLHATATRGSEEPAPIAQ